LNPHAIVVGSGFGGSIAALRLAEAGKRVLVLERGQRWPPAEFPRDPTDTERVFWHLSELKRMRGLFDLRFLSGVGVVAAAGVGGGSLVYANIHIRPDADVFDGWPTPFSRAMLDPFYDKVASALGVAPTPERYVLEKRAWFRRTAAALGFATFDPDEAVAWDDPGEPDRSACQLCASCEFGCTFGAKNTLDFTYLRRAQALGVEIRTGVRMSHVAPSPGGYTVFGEDLDARAPVAHSAPRVVLSAGTLGTNEILLASRDLHGTLPGLSPRLGHGFSANGDFLGTLQGASAELVGWHGPDVTTVMRCNEGGRRFTLAAPTFNRATYQVLASLGVTRKLPEAAGAWDGLGTVLRGAFRLGAFSRPLPLPLPGAGDPARMCNLFAIGRDNGGGRMRLRDGELDIEWSYAEENAELVAAMDAVMAKIAAASGARYAPIPTWTVFRRPMTVHPLGGCHLSESPDRGVVSVRGEVHGYPGLYVADGSVIPTAIGFHPVMTVSAVCEHIAAGLQSE
jgi:cholesterol oxidase